MKIIYYYLLISIFIINSCVSNINSSKSKYLEEITDLENKIEILNFEIQKIENINDKFKYQIKFDKTYNRESFSLQKKLENNQKKIDKYKLLINKYKSEIRILNRKIFKSKVK